MIDDVGQAVLATLLTILISCEIVYFAKEENSVKEKHVFVKYNNDHNKSEKDIQSLIFWFNVMISIKIVKKQMKIIVSQTKRVLQFGVYT